MSVRVSLGPNDDLEVTSPSGRRVYIPVSPNSTKLLWQIIWNSTAEQAQQAKGIVGDFPTQATVDAWAKELGEEKQEKERASRERKFQDQFGFDIKELDIDL